MKITIAEALWLAKQRPHNKRMNRILLMNAAGMRKALLDSRSVSA
jgi:hypothetical protein